MEQSKSSADQGASPDPDQEKRSGGSFKRKRSSVCDVEASLADLEGIATAEVYPSEDDDVGCQEEVLARYNVTGGRLCQHDAFPQN